MDYIVFPCVMAVNGKPATLFSPRDFEDVLRENIGEDAVQVFRQATEGAADELREVTEAIRELGRALETTEALL